MLHADDDRPQVHDYGESPRDLISWILKAVHEKDPSAPPTKKALEEDSRNLIVAGRYTYINSVYL